MPLNPVNENENFLLFLNLASRYYCVQNNNVRTSYTVCLICLVQKVLLVPLVQKVLACEVERVDIINRPTYGFANVLEIYYPHVYKLRIAII